MTPLLVKPQLAQPLLAKAQRLSGYAATFAETDAQADQIDPGAFRATLRARGHRLPLLWQHTMAEPLGHIVSVREDARGLWFEAALAPTRRSADAIALLQRGSLRECSIGFVPRRVRFEQRHGRTIRHIESLDLVEISLVTLAANPGARVTALNGQPLIGDPNGSPQPERTTRQPSAPVPLLRRRLELVLPVAASP